MKIIKTDALFFYAIPIRTFRRILTYLSAMQIFLGRTEMNEEIAARTVELKTEEPT